jgi:hypothetical protein
MVDLFDLTSSSDDLIPSREVGEIAVMVDRVDISLVFDEAGIICDIRPNPSIWVTPSVFHPEPAVHLVEGLSLILDWVGDLETVVVVGEWIISRWLTDEC